MNFEQQIKVVGALNTTIALLCRTTKIAKVRCESNEAWLCVDIWDEDKTLPPEMTAPKKFAIWLNTGALYCVGENGAVEEDPISLSDALRRLDVTVPPHG